jgi:iron complex transport system substrate-binding protein
VKKKKMKTKNVVLVGIAVCAISLLLISPVLANEDETLNIYGNANLDDTIDVGDITYTARIILRLEDPTDLADANYDERIKDNRPVHRRSR